MVTNLGVMSENVIAGVRQEGGRGKPECCIVEWDSHLCVCVYVHVCVCVCV